MCEWTGTRLAGQLERTDRHHFSGGQWFVSHNHLRKRLFVWRDTCRYCHQFGDHERMANGNHKIPRHESIQLCDKSSATNHMGRFRWFFNTKHDQASDGRCDLVSDRCTSHEPSRQFCPWLFSTLHSCVFFGYFCLDDGKEANVRNKYRSRTNSIHDTTNSNNFYSFFP